MTELAIETHDLQKLFGDTRAVDGISLTVPPGTVFGVLGPNGAGKTTMIRMLATLLKLTGGWAKVFGHDVARESEKVRERVSLTGQFASVDEELNGRENLVLIGRLFGFDRPAAEQRANELLEGFGLAEAAEKLVSQYSGGMRRRLDIAASIVISPELLFLDEPTTGLDPRSRNQVWEIVRVMVSAGTTVLLTTQYLEEVDQLAERIAIIDHGKVIAEGTSRELKAQVGGESVQIRLHDPADRPRAQELVLKVLDESGDTGSDPYTLSARVADPVRVADLLRELGEAGIDLAEFSLGQPSLDEVFLALTGHPAEATAAPATAEDAA